MKSSELSKLAATAGELADAAQKVTEAVRQLASMLAIASLTLAAYEIGDLALGRKQDRES